MHTPHTSCPFLPCLALPQVRAYFGIPQRPDATSIDRFNMMAAAAFLVYALWIGITGKKV